MLPRARHTAVWVRDGVPYVFFSRIGDEPERILVTRIENAGEDWTGWRFTRPVTVLRPREAYEGVDEAVTLSRAGLIDRLAHQLRDPAVYGEGGRLYLVYAAGGEHSLALAELGLKTGSAAVGGDGEHTGPS